MNSILKKMFGTTLPRDKEEILLDRKNASKSLRVMRKQRGAQPQYIKARRFDRVRRATVKRYTKLGIM